MNAPDGCALEKCLHTSAQSEVFAAVRESDGRAVILKRYPQDGLAEGESRMQREQEALRQVAGPGIPAVLELIPGEDAPTLVLERAPGVSLASWIEGELPASAAFLEVAIQLTDLLARVHEARLLHRDVSPHSVVVDPADLRTSLIGFGLVRPLGSAAQVGDLRSEVRQATGKLRYTSPEQTGRMDRGVDSRGDLYGLGATLYFVLTRRPPISLDDPLALIHAHMPRMPDAPLAGFRERSSPVSRWSPRRPRRPSGASSAAWGAGSAWRAGRSWRTACSCLGSTRRTSSWRAG